MPFMLSAKLSKKPALSPVVSLTILYVFVMTVPSSHFWSQNDNAQKTNVCQDMTQQCIIFLVVLDVVAGGRMEKIYGRMSSVTKAIMGGVATQTIVEITVERGVSRIMIDIDGRRALLQLDRHNASILAKQIDVLLAKMRREKQ